MAPPVSAEMQLSACPLGSAVIVTTSFELTDPTEASGCHDLSLYAASPEAIGSPRGFLRNVFCIPLRKLGNEQSGMWWDVLQAQQPMCLLLLMLPDYI